MPQPTHAFGETWTGRADVAKTSPLALLLTNAPIRVECIRCGAHRYPSLAPACMVCGAVAYNLVAPNAPDLDAIAKELLDAAELVDVAIHEASPAGVDRDHPAAVRLKAACRNMALARAGRLGF